ncbi:hypothetical protein T439DRAFT_204225 [Meredithblackwellia eburnea MCA 4105]
MGKNGIGRIWARKGQNGVRTRQSTESDPSLFPLSTSSTTTTKTSKLEMNSSLFPKLKNINNSDNAFVCKTCHASFKKVRTSSLPCLCITIPEKTLNTKHPRPKQQNELLKRHSRSHDDSKPYVCVINSCKRGFARSDALLRHYRSLHRDSLDLIKELTESVDTAPPSPFKIRIPRPSRKPSSSRRKLSEDDDGDEDYKPRGFSPFDHSSSRFVSSKGTSTPPAPTLPPLPAAPSPAPPQIQAHAPTPLLAQRPIFRSPPPLILTNNSDPYRSTISLPQLDASTYSPLCGGGVCVSPSTNFPRSSTFNVVGPVSGSGEGQGQGQGEGEGGDHPNSADQLPSPVFTASYYEKAHDWQGRMTQHLPYPNTPCSSSSSSSLVGNGASCFAPTLHHESSLSAKGEERICYGSSSTSTVNNSNDGTTRYLPGPLPSPDPTLYEGDGESTEDDHIDFREKPVQQQQQQVQNHLQHHASPEPKLVVATYSCPPTSAQLGSRYHWAVPSSTTSYLSSSSGSFDTAGLNTSSSPLSSRWASGSSPATSPHKPPFSSSYLY